MDALMTAWAAKSISGEQLFRSRDPRRKSMNGAG